MEIRLSQILAIEPNIHHNIMRNPHFRDWVKKNTASGIVTLLNKYAKEFEIDTPIRWAHYLAQVIHESGGFRYTEEIASGSMYEGRKDLGNVIKGDGVRFKGRGLIQLTGRANFVKYREYCGFDVVSNPTLLSLPVGAIRSSMWYWHTHNLNNLADADDVKAITRRINGGLNGYEQRIRYLNKAKKVLL